MMLFEKLKHGLIVSCQAEEGDPFNSPEAVTMFAQAAILGGARGIRSRDIDKTTMIVKTVNVPVIGLMKDKFNDGTVRITGSFKEVEEILATGIDIVAIDGTFRLREQLRGPEFIQACKEKYDCIIMADVSTFAEGVACADFGADCISTTLSGYTPDTSYYPKDKPDIHIVEQLVKATQVPVFAEGRINTPKDAKRMLEAGAFAVVVGSAVTRPRVITSWYTEKMKEVQ